MKSLKSTLVIIAFLAISGLCFGTWNVSVTGDDYNDGLSYANAFRHINHALSVANDGDVIHVWDGTYVENVVVNLDDIHLEGNLLNPENCNIVASSTGSPTVLIQSDLEDIWFGGFTISGSAYQQLRIVGPSSGTNVLEVERCIINGDMPLVITNCHNLSFWSQGLDINASGNVYEDVYINSDTADLRFLYCNWNLYELHIYLDNSTEVGEEENSIEFSNCEIHSNSIKPFQLQNFGSVIMRQNTFVADTVGQYYRSLLAVTGQTPTSTDVYFSNNTYYNESTYPIYLFSNTQGDTVTLNMKEFYNNTMFTVNELHSYSSSYSLTWSQMANGRGCIPMYNCINEDLDDDLWNYLYPYEISHNYTDAPNFTDSSNDDYSLEWTEDGPGLIGAGYNPIYDDTNEDEFNQDLLTDFIETAEIGAVYYSGDRFATYSFSIDPYFDWKCFPVVDAITESYYNSQYYTNNVLKFFFEEYEGSPSDMMAVGFIDYYVYNGNTYFGVVSQTPTTPRVDYSVSAEKGYKTRFSTASEMTVHGLMVSPTESVSIQEPDVQCWIGYFINKTQSPFDAFGDYLDEVYYIQTKNWTMTREKPERDSPWIYSAGITLSYGEMVIVKRFNDAEDEFVWSTGSKGSSPVIEIRKPQYFTYTEAMNYNPIFIDAAYLMNFDELAVYVDGICLGAAVVLEDGVTMIPAYIDEVNYLGTLEVRAWTAETNQTTTITEFKKEDVDYYYYSMVDDDNQENNEVSIPRLTANNYPNPFNPETTISYYVPKETDVEIAIFNCKGQKVSTLVNEVISSGTHNVLWSGNDGNGKQVTSGVYFYRVKTADNTLIHKMILMK